MAIWHYGKNQASLYTISMLNISSTMSVAVIPPDAFGLVKAYHAHIEVLKKRLIALLTLTYHWRYYRIQRETSWEAQVSPLCDIISGPEIWQRRIKYPVNPLLYGTTTCPSRSLCPNGVMTHPFNHACKRGSFIFAWAGLSDRGSNHINIKEGRHLKKKYANYQN